MAPRAGLNGNYHREHLFALESTLAAMGIQYHGDGAWTLPPGAQAEACDTDDWVLTLADGSQWYVWTEEEPQG